MEVLQFVPQELRDVLYNIDLDKAWLSWCGSAKEGRLVVPCLKVMPTLFGTRGEGWGPPPLVVCTPRPGLMRLTPLIVVISSILHLRRFWCSGAECIQYATSLSEFGPRGWTTAWWQALVFRWAAVCWQGPVGPITSLEPWKDWLLQICMGSTSGPLIPWVFFMTLYFGWL